MLAAGHADAAEQALAALRQTGQLTERQPACAALWARTAAERGDMAAFRVRLDQYVDWLGWSQVNEPTRETLAVAMPVRPLPTAVQKEVADVAERSIDRVAARWPGDPNWTRSLTALGRWCHERGVPADTERLLVKATDLAKAQGDGEHSPWVADLAFLLGHDDQGWSTERRLFDAGCLPAVRIPTLVSHLNATGETDAAAAIVNRAAAWCQEPTVVARSRPAASFR